jgi:hypothetical protein
LLILQSRPGQRHWRIYQFYFMSFVPLSSVTRKGMSPEINKEARESIQEELSCLFFRTHAKEHADSTDTLWTSHTTPYWHHQEHVHGVCLPLAFQVILVPTMKYHTNWAGGGCTKRWVRQLSSPGMYHGKEASHHHYG